MKIGDFFSKFTLRATLAELLKYMTPEAAQQASKIVARNKLLSGLNNQEKLMIGFVNQPVLTEVGDYFFSRRGKSRRMQDPGKFLNSYKDDVLVETHVLNSLDSMDQAITRNPFAFTWLYNVVNENLMLDKGFRGVSFEMIPKYDVVTSGLEDQWHSIDRIIEIYPRSIVLGMDAPILDPAIRLAHEIGHALDTIHGEISADLLYSLIKQYFAGLTDSEVRDRLTDLARFLNLDFPKSYDLKDIYKDGKINKHSIAGEFAAFSVEGIFTLASNSSDQSSFAKALEQKIRSNPEAIKMGLTAFYAEALYQMSKTLHPNDGTSILVTLRESANLYGKEGKDLASKEKAVYDAIKWDAIFKDFAIDAEQIIKDQLQDKLNSTDDSASAKQKLDADQISKLAHQKFERKIIASIALDPSFKVLRDTVGDEKAKGLLQDIITRKYEEVSTKSHVGDYLDSIVDKTVLDVYSHYVNEHMAEIEKTATEAAEKLSKTDSELTSQEQALKDVEAAIEKASGKEKEDLETKRKNIEREIERLAEEKAKAEKEKTDAEKNRDAKERDSKEFEDKKREAEERERKAREKIAE